MTRKSKKLYYTIFKNGYELYDDKFKYIAFIGKKKSFFVIDKGKIKKIDVLKLIKEDDSITFTFYKNKQIDEKAAILCISSNYNKPSSLFLMSFQMMKTFINIFMKDNYKIDLKD